MTKVRLRKGALFMTDASPFMRFVIDRLGLNESHFPDVANVTDAGNTIGAICVRLGLINVFDIDRIIEVQRSERHRRFGEIAIDLGLLSSAGLDGVLALQHFYRAVEPAVLLVISKQVSLARLLALWTEFEASRQS